MATHLGRLVADVLQHNCAGGGSEQQQFVFKVTTATRDALIAVHAQKVDVRSLAFIAQA